MKAYLITRRIEADGVAQAISQEQSGRIIEVIEDKEPGCNNVSAIGFELQ